MGYFGSPPLVMFFTVRSSVVSVTMSISAVVLYASKRGRCGATCTIFPGLPCAGRSGESICAFGTGDYRRTRRNSNGLAGRRRCWRVHVSSVRSSLSTILSCVYQTSIAWKALIPPMRPATTGASCSRRDKRGSAFLAWAYVVESSSGSHLPGGRWPPWQVRLLTS